MIYLDNGATSKFKPKEVIKAVHGATLNSANPGRSSHRDAVNCALTVYKTREKLSNFVGAKGYNVVFTKNCTEALNLALTTIPRGARVVSTVCEHNSVLRPLYRLAREKGVKVVTLTPSINGHVPPYRVENALKENTYMFICNHVSNVNGVTADIEQLGKITAKRGVKFLVDGAQSIGHIPIDMNLSHIDMLALPCHKGLLDIQGLGALVFNDRVNLSPIILGGTGTNSESVNHPKDIPEAYESGTLPYPAIAGLNASIDYLNEHGRGIINTISYLTNELIYGLKKIKGVTIYTPDNALTGVVSFNIHTLPSSSVSDILNERYDIATRSGLHCAPLMHNHLKTLEQGTVRASIGAGNTIRDIRALLYAVDKISKMKI